VSSGGSGHSDYLRSIAVCKDFAVTVNGAREHGDRRPTQNAHVFNLQNNGKSTKAQIADVCKLPVE